jgi:hypothetical protein
MKKCKTEGCDNDLYCKEMCKGCYNKKYLLDHKDKIKGQKRQWEMNHKEEIKINRKQYDLDHKEEKAEYFRQYYLENKEEIKMNSAQYRTGHIEERKEYDKQYRSDHLEEIKERDKQYRSDHKEEKRESDRQYSLDHKEERRAYSKLYNSSHKEETNNRQKRRRKSDPMFKIMQNASNAVNAMLKQNGGSKQGKSSRKYLPFTKDQLEAHLEVLFSHPDNLDENGNVWMTLKNQGRYDPNHRTWHLDHIDPKSKFKCKNMEEESFKECWALSNLRPLEAIKNLKKGNR